MQVTPQVTEASELAWSQVDKLLADGWTYETLGSVLRYSTPASLQAAHKKRSALAHHRRRSIDQLLNGPELTDSERDNPVLTFQSSADKARLALLEVLDGIPPLFLAPRFVSWVEELDEMASFDFNGTGDGDV